MWLFLVLLLSSVTVEARVRFDMSDVLDNVDLQGKDTASFNCNYGCKVYSPTKNDKIVIIDSNGQEITNLLKLAGISFGESFELPRSSTPYRLKNKGSPNPSFVLYLVQKGASYYNTEVAYLDASSNLTLRSDNLYKMFTILSTSGSIRFSDFKNIHEAALPIVYTTGFDTMAISEAVYTARSVATALQTSFSVYSPIASVYFPRTGDQSVRVSGDSIQSSMSQDSSAVYVSPGYVGCPIAGSQLYSLIPPITSINASVSLSRQAGLSLVFDGYYTNQADNLELTVNSDVMKLTGKNQFFSKKYNSTQCDVKLAWSKTEGSKDGFAMQIDIESK